MGSIVRFPAAAERTVQHATQTINESFESFARECIAELDARLAALAIVIRAVPEEALGLHLEEDHMRVLRQVHEIRQRLADENRRRHSAE